MTFKRVVLIVLDSVGMGEAPDAAAFGDAGANTLGHISEWCARGYPDYSLPNLSRWGLARLLPGAHGLDAKSPAQGASGALIEKSPGKDTTTGHWEMAGTVLKKPFPAYPQGFSEELLRRWAKENQLPGWLCNASGSGTQVIEDFGEEHIRSGKPIVYTSADSVWQIAASEESFGLERLRSICASARRYADELNLGRVIARPFTGRTPADFKRTGNRKDYSQPPPSPNLLDVIVHEGGFVAGVGKIDDIFAHRSITLSEHTSNNESSYPALLSVLDRTQGQRGLIFVNLIDFDQSFGHRRDPKGYAECLEDFDAFLPTLEKALGSDDLAIVTADHGNDPTHSGTDHTREKVPFLVWSKRPGFRPVALGDRRGFATCARLVLDALGIDAGNVSDAASSDSLLPLMGEP